MPPERIPAGHRRPCGGYSSLSSRHHDNGVASFRCTALHLPHAIHPKTSSRAGWELLAAYRARGLPASVCIQRAPLQALRAARERHPRTARHRWPIRDECAPDYAPQADEAGWAPIAPELAHRATARCSAASILVTGRRICSRAGAGAHPAARLRTSGFHGSHRRLDCKPAL